MKLVITGGHHSSALPVISLLQKSYPEVELFWFGHRHSVKGNKTNTLEYIEINKLNIPFFDIKAGKFYKTYNIVRLLRIPFGFLQTLFLLLKIKPDVILSFGGYIAVPTVISGWILGIPSVTHEQTVVVGYANGLISKFVKKIMVSWKESKKFFKKDKVVYTGLPLRRALFEVRSNNFDVNTNLPTLYVTAGKTGSHKINVLLEESLPDLLEICNVIHQCGDHSEYRDYERLKEKYSDYSSSGEYIARKFVLEDEIGEVFSKADLVVSRAGAHTTRELLEFKKPCVLIPIPWVSHNEQYKNAAVLKNNGLAVVLDEDEVTPETLIENIRNQFERANVSEQRDLEYDDSTTQKIIDITLSYAKS